MPSTSIHSLHSKTSRFSRYLADLATRPSPDTFNQTGSRLDNLQSPIGEFDATFSPTALIETSHAVNPESDSYLYIESLLEALAVLGKLGNALETIAQRVPSEIHAMIQTTLDEVDER